MILLATRWHRGSLSFCFSASNAMLLQSVYQDGGDGGGEASGPLLLEAKTGQALMELCCDAFAREPYEVVSVAVDGQGVDYTSREGNDAWHDQSLVTVRFVSTLEDMIEAIERQQPRPDSLVFSSHQLAAAVRRILDTEEAHEVFEITTSCDRRADVRGQHISRMSSPAAVVKIATLLVAPLVPLAVTAYQQRNENQRRTQLLRDAIAGANAGTLQIEVYADRITIRPNEQHRS